VPLAFVVAVVVPPKAPPPVAIAAVTAMPSCPTLVPLAFLNCIAGCCGKGTPPCAVADGCVTIPSCVAAGAVTVTVALPVLPSLVATIGVLPAATAVTSPLELTVATVVAPLLHATERPVSTLPEASVAVEVAWVVVPAATVADARDTVTVATGTAAAITVTVAEPVTPPMVARICAVSGATAVTIPALDTVATCVADDDQVMVPPMITVPDRSVATACAVIV